MFRGKKTFKVGYIRISGQFQDYIDKLTEKLGLGFNLYSLGHLMGIRETEQFVRFVNGFEISPRYIDSLLVPLERLDRVVAAIEKVVRTDYILEWLTKSNKAFGNKAPEVLLQSDEGVEKILRIIDNLESGSFS